MNDCKECRLHAHRITGAERCIEMLEKRVRTLEGEMIDLRNQSKITIAIITLCGGVVSSMLTLIGVIAVPIIRGLIGI